MQYLLDENLLPNYRGCIFTYPHKVEICMYVLKYHYHKHKS